jgi:hypothetical protein
MVIGDFITHRGRRWEVVGFTPFSVRPAQVELESPETGERLWVVWPPLEEVERAASRVVPPGESRDDRDG